MRGPDEEAVRSTFSEALLEFFEARADEKVSVEGAGDTLICYRARRRIKPEDTRDFMEWGFRFYALFKGDPNS